MATPTPTITLAPTSELSGATVHVSGSGFPRKATGDLLFGMVPVAQVHTAGSGRFTASFVVPSGSGVVTVTVDVAGTRVTAPFTILAAPSPDPLPVATALSWAPPTLTSPITKMITAAGSYTLNTGQDYVIDMPTKISGRGGVALVGGRNLRLIGGEITIPTAGYTAINDRRGLYFANQTGTVHCEGVDINNSGGDLTEGIQVNAKDAIVQLQNCRVTGIHAHDELGYTDNHPDLVQAWGGCQEIRIDRFSGSTDYQGMQLAAAYNTIGRIVMRNVNMWGLPPELARYLIWIGNDSDFIPTELTEVYLVPRPGRSLGQTVWPHDAFPDTRKRAILSGDGQTVTWPEDSLITGSVKMGPPPDGDFVPAGVAGLGYVSPGYA